MMSPTIPALAMNTPGKNKYLGKIFITNSANTIRPAPISVVVMPLRFEAARIVIEESLPDIKIHQKHNNSPQQDNTPTLADFAVGVPPRLGFFFISHDLLNDDQYWLNIMLIRILTNNRLTLKKHQSKLFES